MGDREGCVSTRPPSLQRSFGDGVKHGDCHAVRSRIMYVIPSTRHSLRYRLSIHGSRSSYENSRASTNPTFPQVKPALLYIDMRAAGEADPGNRQSGKRIRRRPPPARPATPVRRHGTADGPGRAARRSTPPPLRSVETDARVAQRACQSSLANSFH